MNKRRVVITGLGVLAPNGNSLTQYWNALISGKSGIGPIKGFDAENLSVKIAGELSDFNPEDHFNRKEVGKLDPFSIYALVTAQEAISQAGLNNGDVNKERIGVIIGFGSFHMDYESNSDVFNGTTTTYSTKSEFKEGIAVGFNAAIGLNYALNEKLTLFGEVNYIGMSYEPLKWTLTEMNRDGTDLLPQLEIVDKEIEFVDSYIKDRSNINPDEPGKELKTSTPFSSIGLNFGVKFNL